LLNVRHCGKASKFVCFKSGLLASLFWRSESRKIVSTKALDMLSYRRFATLLALFLRCHTLCLEFFLDENQRQLLKVEERFLGTVTAAFRQLGRRGRRRQLARRGRRRQLGRRGSR
jgi:hypothetical protein